MAYDGTGCRFDEIFWELMAFACRERLEIVFATPYMVILKTDATLDGLSDLWKSIDILKKKAGASFDKIIPARESFYAVLTNLSQDKRLENRKYS